MNNRKVIETYKLLKVTIVMVIAMVFIQGCAEQNPPIKIPDVPPPVSKMQKKPRVALVLSSGGFRGAAHIGVLEVLEENNVPVDLIVGSSSGSFVGAFYADEPSAAAIKRKLLHLRYQHLIDPSWIEALCAPFSPTGPVRGCALRNFMFKNMRARDFNELKIPLVVVATSLVNNQAEILQSGPIIPAVHASSALPPYFAPVKMYENVYTDGGVIMPVPVNVAQGFDPGLIIAVDICMRPSLSEVQNAFQIAGRAIDISRHELAISQANEADIVIRPDIVGYGPFDDGYSHDFYLAGRKAALAHIEEIKQAVLKIKE